MQQRGTVDRVRDLGMELDAVDAALAILHADDPGVGAGGGLPEAGRQPGDVVAMTHPDRLARNETREQDAGLGDFDLGPAVLAARRTLDGAAEEVRDELHAVTDPEHGDPELEQSALGARRVVVVDALRSAREDDSDRLTAADLLDRQVERVHLAVDAVLAHAAGDQLRELAAEIEDEDGLMGCHAELYRRGAGAEPVRTAPLVTGSTRV